MSAMSSYPGTRRQFLKATGQFAIATVFTDVVLPRVHAAEASINGVGQSAGKLDPALARDWFARWEKNILGDMRNRYCDREMGEEIGWLVSPFLNGFYHAKFQRIDGGKPDARWKNSPGLLWTALLPYDETLRKVFVANHDPASWGGLAVTPCFRAREATTNPTKA